ncbi:MAG: BON domain-containing protein [Pseudomonadota bacterium]
MKTMVVRLCMIVFAATLAACTATPTSRAAGEVVDDATLTARVKTELAQTQGVGDALAINVDTYRGVVSLAGFVDNEQQARAAVTAARSVPGVREVRNNLQVKPKK